MKLTVNLFCGRKVAWSSQVMIKQPNAPAALGSRGV
jgi:hypothetical protein